ncbi:helix-turn-helix domain-containing protein [Roseovarius indicus]|uniref:helix-turn-helix domain-containing protein n=1 Tax=Roseovarius indicus TaxID=540747 RepID=UPI0040592685
MSAGTDVRTLRKNRGWTLVRLAHEMDKSLGWMSQAERDISRISEQELKQLAGILQVDPSLLMPPEAADPREEGRIVRANRRRSLGFRREGLTEFLISPDLTDSFEAIHSTFQPGQQLLEPLQRATQELGFMLSGKLDLWFGEQKFVVEKGDSFRIRNEPYRWANPYTSPAEVLWMISPPIY